VKKVHDGNHLLISIRLFFNEDCLGGKDPRSFVEVFSQGDIDTVFVFRGYARYVPFHDEVGCFVE
jgi:hypothetical protein